MESFHSSFVARNAEYELNESDVPGASLKGRNPGMLTVPELKRWLACRGALRGGRKADVVLRVSSYIQEGLDKRIIDPDGGQNVERKRQKLVESGLASLTGHSNLDCAVAFPDENWSKSLRNLPNISFGTIYHHFMERSLEVMLGLETKPTSSQSAASDSASSQSTDFTSFRGIMKGYRFFKDGHVQEIEFHDAHGSSSSTSYCFVRCKVLPSMKKTQPYRVRVCLDRKTCFVSVAYCVCTAGLAGCCNHVAALLYGLEEFVRLGLMEKPESPTSRLCS